uniref:Uncharacterized protein n=1 Tax=Lepeophtheirus salmonis TaxID=72036 RepID=A0A0K2UFL2_LEPSM
MLQISSIQIQQIWIILNIIMYVAEKKQLKVCKFIRYFVKFLGILDEFMN